jgi:protein-tyrosine phosphatase
MSLITPHLYLGDANDAQNVNFLKSRKISLIVNCAKEIPNYFEKSNPPPPPFKYLRLDLNDVPTQPIDGALKVSSGAILNNISKGLSTFVHCRAGISRSSSVVIYTIMRLHDWPFETAYRFVKDMHPKTHPNPGFVDQLIKLQDGSTQNRVIDRKESKTLDEGHETAIFVDDPNMPGVYGVVDSQNSSEQVTSLTLDNENPRPAYARGVKNTYAKIFSGSR